MVKFNVIKTVTVAGAIASCFGINYAFVTRLYFCVPATTSPIMDLQQNRTVTCSRIHYSKTDL